MDCLNARMLSDLEAGRLDASVEAEARAHVAACERCRKELEPAPEKKAVEAVPASLPVGTKLPLSVACTFCKGALERREAVYCASCLAPHHADCWKTHGCCATCSHRSFVRAEKTLETTDEGAARTRTARGLALALGCLAAAAAAAVLSRSEPQSDRVASPEPLPVRPGTVTAPTAEPSRPVPTPEETRPRATTEPPPVPTPAPAATSEPTPRPRSVRPGGLRLVSTLGTYDWKPGVSTWVAISPDGKLGLVGTRSGDVKRFDLETGKELPLATSVLGTPIGGSMRDCASLAISPDGRRGLAVSTAADAVRVWDLGAFSLEKDIPVAGTLRGHGHGDNRRIFALSPDGARFVVATSRPGGADRVDLYDVETGNPIRSFEPCDGASCAAWSQDGRRLLVGMNRRADARGGAFAAFDQRFLLFDVETGAVVSEWTKEKGFSLAVELSPDGKRALVRELKNNAGQEPSLRLWDVDSRTELRSIPLAPSPGADDGIAFTADGKRALACGNGAAGLEVWDVETGQLVERVWARVKSASFSRGGDRVLVAEDFGVRLRLFEGATGREIRTSISGHAGPVLALGSLPGGEILSSGADRKLHVWSPDDALVRSVAAEPRRDFSPSPGGADAWEEQQRKDSIWKGFTGVSPEGKRCLSWAGGPGEFAVWSLETQDLVRRFPGGGGGGYREVAISPDGRSVLATYPGIEPSVHCWDVERGEIVWKAGVPGLSIVFFPDGKTALVGNTSSFEVIDRASGKSIRRVDLARNATDADVLMALAISADGKTLAASLSGPPFFQSGRTLSSASAGSLELWDLETGRMLVSQSIVQDHVTALLFGVDGKTLYAGTQRGVIQRYEILPAR